MCTQIPNAGDIEYIVDADEGGSLLFAIADEPIDHGVIEEIISAPAAVKQQTGHEAPAPSDGDAQMNDAASLSSLSDLSDSHEDGNVLKSAGKPEGDAAMLDPNASVAERAKASRRRKGRVSYVDDSDSNNEGENRDGDVEWIGIKSASDQLVVRMEVPITMTRAERDRRLRTINVWLPHLQVLAYHEDRKFTAVKACRSSNSVHSVKRTDAHRSLADELIKGVRATITALEGATRVSSKTLHDMEIVGELNELWADLEEAGENDAERGGAVEAGRSLKAFVKQALQKKKRATRANRRTSFKRSPYSKDVREYRKLASFKAIMKPLSDEVSLRAS